MVLTHLLLLFSFPVAPESAQQARSQKDSALIKAFCEKKGDNQSHLLGDGFEPYEQLAINYDVARKQMRHNAFTEHLRADEQGRFYKTLGLFYHHEQGGENRITVLRKNEKISILYMWGAADL